MYVKELIWNLMPYGLYRYFKRKNNPDLFTDNFLSFLDTIDKEDGIIVSSQAKSYDSIVSVEGLGYSGSGAVIDFLSEINVCYVLRDARTRTNNKNSNYELDFLRLSGGLFEFEHYLSGNNIYQNDALVNRFVDCLNTFPLFRCDKYIQKIFFKFLKDVLDLSIIDTNGVSPNYHLPHPNRKSSIFYLKNMSTVHYRQLCKNLLIEFFSYLNSEKKSILVMDQFLCDQEFDMERYKEYIPECKTIVVYRDPRDVYAFAVQQNVEWIAHNDVHAFIKWFEIMIRQFDLQSNDYLVVQFEKFVTDYPNESRRVLSYLGIDEKQHNANLKNSYFNPDISVKNVGIWKSSSMLQGDFEIISQRLGDYCFN